MIERTFCAISFPEAKAGAEQKFFDFGVDGEGPTKGTALPSASIRTDYFYLSMSDGLAFDMSAARIQR